MHPTTTETEIFTTHPTTSGIKKGKGHHKPASKFTIPPEYTRTTEQVHHQTEPVTSYPETTQQVYTTHPTTSGVKKGKGHHKPATMFTIPPEYTQTTEPAYYPTDPVTMHPTTTEKEIFTTHPTTSGIKEGKGHTKPASRFTIPPEYTRTTEPVHYTTEQITIHPETTQDVHITQPSTPGIKKGKGHQKPGYMFTIPPEFTRTTNPVHYSTEPTNFPGPTEEIHITQPTTSWAKKGKGHYKPASKFTIPSEYTMTTQSINPFKFTTVTKNVETFNPMDYDQSTLPAEFSTIKEEPHQTSTYGHPDTTFPHGNEQSDDEQFTVPGYESTKSASSEIGNPEDLVTSKPLFFTEPPIKYEVSTPGSYQFTQSYDMQTDSQSTEFPHYEEVPSTYTNPLMQNTEPSHYETNKYTDFYQSTVPVEIPHDTSTGSPHYEEFSTIHTDSLMQNTETSPYHTDKYSDYDQATVPVEMAYQTPTKNPHYEASSTQTMQYTTPTYHQIDKYIGLDDDDQVTVPVEIPTPQSTKYPSYQEFPTTHSDLSMQFTDSPQYHYVVNMEDEQATVPVEITTKYPHYEDHSTTYPAPSMQYTESSYHSVKYTDDDQATVPVEILTESSTKYPHYEDHSTSAPSMQSTEYIQYTDKHTDDDQATVPVEIPSESSTKNPHYEFSTIQPESSSQYTTLPSHYHSVEGSDDQATVPIEVAIETTTQMESHHIGSTSSYKQSTEFDSGLQAKVPLFPSENEEQHHLNVDFSDDDNGDDFDQQSITHPYFTHPKASTPANSPGELDWRSGSTVHINPKKKYTVAPSDFFLTPIAPFKPVEFIPPQPYKEWPSHSALNNTGIEQVKVPDTIQVDLKGYPSYAENRPGIKGRGGRHNMISKPWYFISRTIH
ncbi:hypothetical protein LSTR_LSTR004948 [Laodelphax striatellus]|uniref:Uncharacterized protein n=1 Tax=Laodelphax striatellus TaxID=195883 RepID=A0A482XPB7_LAOST|nr:hypothetical protein LSTR_LSTR004948 [Laodelphax striatellus]